MSRRRPPTPDQERAADHAWRLAALGAELRAARERAGVTLSGLAAELGLSRQFLTDLEAGRTSISLIPLFDLCHRLDLDLVLQPVRRVYGARTVEVPPPGQTGAQLVERVKGAAERLGLGLPVAQLAAQLDIEAGPAPARRKR